MLDPLLNMYLLPAHTDIARNKERHMNIRKCSVIIFFFVVLESKLKNKHNNHAKQAVIAATMLHRMDMRATAGKNSANDE
jgi:hypothetical protein